jgi:YD repeat-containing protein
MSTVEKIPIPTITTYSYGSSQHLLPTQIATSRSDGRTTTTKKYYPLDTYAGLSTQAQAAKTALANLHIISPEIAVETTIGPNTEVVRKNYKVFNAVPLPESIDTKQNTSVFDTRYVFLNYDALGNLLCQSKANDFSTAYIWGYNGAYPIAEVKNASSDQIFHTSFEENGNSAPGDARTGTKSKTGGFVTTLTRLTPGSYILTWWSKSGTWRLQSQIVNVSATSYTINVSGQVDEIRFCPSNAQMTTYTYEPLVGMKSMMDANHRLTRFDYDTLGRLSVVFDHDGNVSKKYTYNYQLR